VAIRYLLDTNIVSFHIRESSAALRRRLRRVDASTVALSVVTEMEIRRRIRGLRVVDWTR
jgi:predicted nucleic acid-binding protein